MRGVVENDDPAQFATQKVEVLHVEALLEDAGLSEETNAEISFFVEKIQERICILEEPMLIHSYMHFGNVNVLIIIITI